MSTKIILFPESIFFIYFLQNLNTYNSSGSLDPTSSSTLLGTKKTIPNSHFSVVHLSGRAVIL